jgi:hypothetical protein
MATKSNLTRSVERGDRYGDDQGAAKRVRLLFRNLLAKYGAGQNRALAETACLRIAELTIASETLRARLLATTDPDDGLVNAVTRMESTIRRATVDLAAGAGAAAEKGWTPDDLPKVIDDDDDEQDDAEAESAEAQADEGEGALS